MTVQRKYITRNKMDKEGKRNDKKIKIIKTYIVKDNQHI